MIDSWPLLSFVSVLTVAHYLSVSRRQGLFTMDGIFVLTQWVMSVGTLSLLDLAHVADRTHSIVITTAITLYVTVSIATHYLLATTWRHTPSPVKTVLLYRPSRAVYALLILSICVTVAYFQAVGYNTFALGLRNMFTGVTADYTTLRLESYGGTRYLFPGYVNQFKNAILPALTVVVTVYLYRTRHPRRLLLAAPLIGVSLFGILGTGQRGAFIQFTLTLLTFLYLLDRARFPRRALLAGIALAPLLFLSTFLLGRSAPSLAQASGFGATFRTLAAELGKRVLHDNQFSGLVGFRYIFGQPTRNGSEWFDSLLGVLPGHSGSPLARELFRSLYGTDRGTAPASIWGSVYLNFGWHGIIAVPVLLAIIYQIASFRAMMTPVSDTLELIGMSGTFVVFGNWVAGGPEYVMNAGGVTFAVLWWIGRRTTASAVLTGGAAIDLRDSSLGLSDRSKDPLRPSRSLP